MVEMEARIGLSIINIHASISQNSNYFVIIIFYQMETQTNIDKLNHLYLSTVYNFQYLSHNHYNDYTVVYMLWSITLTYGPYLFTTTYILIK